MDILAFKIFRIWPVKMYIVTPLRISTRSQLSDAAVVFGLGRTGSQIFGIRPTIKSTKIAFFENFIRGGGHKK